MTKIPKELSLQLIQLGLSEREASVYVLLVSLKDQVGAGKLVTLTGWHRQYVYASLKELEAKGLTQTVVVRGRQKFSITKHDALLALVAQKQKTAELVTKELLVLAGQDKAQDFQVFQGTDTFVRHEFEELKKASVGSVWSILGADGDLFDIEMGADLELFHKERAEKNITIRYIGSPAQASALTKWQASHLLIECRILPHFSDSSCVTLIREASVSTRSYGEPVLNYELYSEVAARSQRNFFDALWKVCVPVTE